AGRRATRNNLPRRDQRPAVVVTALDAVQLVAAGGPVLGGPHLSGHWMERQPLRVAVTQAQDRRQRAGTSDKRVVARRRAVGVDAMNLPCRSRQVLGIVLVTAVAD